MAYSSEVKLGTYIVGRIYYSTSATSSGHNVYVEWQCRRTNSYAGATLHYPSSSYITINGNNQTWNWTKTDHPSIPGNDTGWKTFCSRTYHVSHTSATNITVSAGNSNMGPHLTGSASTSVYLGSIGPTYTPPNQASISLSSQSGRYAHFNCSVSSFGSGVGPNRLYLMAGTSSGSLSSHASISSASGTMSYKASSPGTYYFGAQASNETYYGQISNVISVRFDGYGVSGATVSNGGVTQTSIYLNYGPSGNSYGWPSSGTSELYGGTSPSSMTLLASGSSAPNSYTYSGLEPGTTYYFQCVAKNNSYGSSATSSIVQISTRYASPSNVTAQLLESNKDGQAIAQIKVGNWGAKSSAGTFSVLDSSRIVKATVSASSNTSVGIPWTIPITGSNTLGGAITTWYGRATNNHNEYLDSTAYYLVTPSAPIVNYLGHPGTNPYLTRQNTVTYSGGTTNSTTANTAPIEQWTFYHTRLSDNKQSDPITIQSSARRQDMDYHMDEFTSDSNYTFTTKVSNTLGGVAITTSKTYYCPSGVGGRPTMITPDQVELLGSANAPGGNGDTTSGTISCYQLQWGESATALTNSSDIQVSPYFMLEELIPDTTYYYRIIAWNTYGLSGQSPVMNFTTGGRYLPTVGDFEFTPRNPGADITVNVRRSGGVTPNELPINCITIELSPAGEEDWTMVKDIDGLNLFGGDSYDIENVWSDYLEKDGNYELKITLHNEFDSNRRIFTLIAPSIVSLTTPGLDNDTPTQIKLNATIMAGTASVDTVEMRLTGASLDINKTDNVDIASNETTTSTIISPNYLLFDTTYIANVTARDTLGLWSTTKNGVNIKTPPRFTWHYVTATKTTEGSASYRNGGLLKNMANAYYIVNHALGDLKVNDSLKNKRLKFISHPLFYRPESVAAIMLSNGQRIAYEYDAKADVYKFGIWNSRGILRTFYDGEHWLSDHYDFDNSNIHVTGLVPNGKGMNASSAFSTTSIEDI